VPARDQGVARVKNALTIPLDKLMPDPDQPRKTFEPESIERLAESLRTRGQLQPIRVRWDEATAKYVVLIGERRWRAAMAVGRPALTCVVHEADLTAQERLALQLIENALREDLNPVEQAHAYKRLMDVNGWSYSQLGRELNIPQSAVSQAMALLTLPVEVQAKVEAGELAARTAYELRHLDDAADQRELAERATSAGLTGAEVAATVKARKLGKAKAEPPAKVEFKFDDGGKLTVTLPPGMAGPAAVVEMLQRGLKKARAELKQAGPSQAA
jgi:ParB family chromosome partitioning protein